MRCGSPRVTRRWLQRLRSDTGIGRAECETQIHKNTKSFTPLGVGRVAIQHHSTHIWIRYRHVVLLVHVGTSRHTGSGRNGVAYAIHTVQTNRTITFNQENTHSRCQYTCPKSPHRLLGLTDSIHPRRAKNLAQDHSRDAQAHVARGFKGRV